MRKRFSLVVVLIALLQLTATAQIPLTLQITVTNGVVTVLSSSNSAGLYGVAQFETTTNLSLPIIWSQSNWTGGSVLFNSPATKPQEFFRFVQSYPVFQFAIFYNLNMEIAAGSSMTIAGPVFCNQNIWEGSEYMIFSNIVDAVGTNYTAANDPFATDYVPHNGTPPGNFLPGQHVSGTSALNLAVTNAHALLDLPPISYAFGTSGAYSTNGQFYIANAADLYITNFPSGTNNSTPKGTNVLAYYQDSSTANFTNVVPYDFYILKTGGSTNYVTTILTAGIDSITNVRYASYSFVINVFFYDWREGGNNGSGPPKAIQAIQIDLAKFNIWRTNSATNGGNYYDTLCVLDKGHHIDSIYVYTDVPVTTATLPALRLINGQTLPSAFSGLNGFTIATPFPLYIKGNYNVNDGTGSSIATNNTTHTYPAALMADAVTILSTNWNDSTITEAPTPGNTTVNAAMLGGIVQTDPTISGDYSGGVENFLRLLEDWQGSIQSGSQKTLTYNGSIVVMFPSEYATNRWSFGSYYTAPVRNWSFDSNFTQINKLPPLTPFVVNFRNP